MQRASHRIRRQKWLVHTGSAEEAFAWRKLLRDKGQDILLPVLEKAFDEAVKGNHVIHIPRIELKVKIDSEKHVSEALFNQIIQQLREQIQHLLHEQVQSTMPHPMWKESTTQKDWFESLLYYLRTGLVPWQEANASAQEITSALADICREEWPQLLDYAEKNHEKAPFYSRLLQLVSEEQFGFLVRALSDRIPLKEQLQHLMQEQKQSTRQHLVWKESTTQKDRFETFLYYLRTGSVPWQAAHASAHEIAIALTETCREEWPQLLDYVLKNYERASFFFRLLQLISEEQFGFLMSALSDRIPQGVRPAVIQCITGLLHSAKTIFSRYTRIRIIASILSESLSWRENTKVSGLFSVAVDAVPQEEMPVFYDFISTLPSDVAALFQQEKPDRSGDENDTAVVLGIGGNVQPDFLSSLHVEEGQTNTGRVNPGIFDNEAGQSYSPIVTDYPMQNKPEEDVFPFLVHQAGLVLLHPFILRFFESTGIIEKGDIQLSLFSLARAAALLHFLATGREEVYEYEIGFIKILLGMHPESPLPVCEGLVKSCDKEEAESLLQSVITHWSALKNTSVRGLRSSFLQRQALLREDENGWKLRVERAPFDVLLDQLPWSISIVKLPWMKKTLYIEW